MAEQVVIEFIGDASGLKPLADALKALGQLTDEQIKAFNDALKASETFAQKSGKAIKETGKSAEDLNKQINELVQAIIGGATEEFAEQIRKMGLELPKVSENSKRLTTQLRDLKNQLATLPEGSKEFKKVAIEAAKLEDKIGDVSKEVRILASDSLALDTMTGIARGIAGGFALAQGAAALFGKENEDVQKALLKVNAAMAILQGLQEVSLVLRKEEVVRVGLAAAAQKAYAFVVNTTTGAIRVMNLALASLGVGLAIAAVVALVTYWEDIANFIGIAADNTEREREEQEKLQAVLKEVNDELIEKKRLQQLEANAKDGGLDDLQRRLGLLKAQGAGEKELFDLQQEIRKKELANIKGLYQASLNLGENRLVFEKQINDKLNEIEVARLEFNRKQGEKDLENKKKQKEKELEISKEVDDILRRRAEFRAKLESDREERAESRGRTALSNARVEVLATEQGTEARLAAEANFLTAKRNADLLSAQNSITNEEELAAKKLEINAEYYDSLRQLQDEYDAKKKEKDDEDLAKQLEKQEIIKQNAISIAQQTFDAIFQITSARRNAEFEEELAALDREKEAKLANKKLTDGQRAAIEAQYRKKEAKIKEEQFKKDKAAAIVQALINGALAIATTIAKLGAPPSPAGIAGLAAVAASTALSVASIAAQPIPKFAKGTKDAEGGLAIVGERGKEIIAHDGSFQLVGKGLVNLPKHAKVIPHPESMKILDGHVDTDRILSDYNINTTSSTNIDYHKLATELGKELAKHPKTTINVDENGLRVFIQSENHRVERLEKRYASK